MLLQKEPSRRENFHDKEYSESLESRANLTKWNPVARPNVHFTLVSQNQCSSLQSEVPRTPSLPSQSDSQPRGGGGVATHIHTARSNVGCCLQHLPHAGRGRENTFSVIMEVRHQPGSFPVLGHPPLECEDHHEQE